MSLSVVSSAELFAAYPTGIGLWGIYMGLLMPGQVSLLCKYFAEFLTGEHHHGLSKNPEYQWWFCHRIYCSDVDVKEVTLLPVAHAQNILPVTSLPVAPPHRSTANTTLSVPIYYYFRYLWIVNSWSFFVDVLFQHLLDHFYHCVVQLLFLYSSCRFTRLFLIYDTNIHFY